MDVLGGLGENFLFKFASVDCIFTYLSNLIMNSIIDGYKACQNLYLFFIFCISETRLLKT